MSINDNGTLVSVNKKLITYGYSTYGIYRKFNFYNGFFILLTSYINGFSLQLNKNINASLSTTLWFQNIARVKKQNNTYMINF
jgi:hypothetical protein